MPREASICPQRGNMGEGNKRKLGTVSTSFQSSVNWKPISPALVQPIGGFYAPELQFMSIQ